MKNKAILNLINNKIVWGFLIICIFYTNSYTYLIMPHIPTNEDFIEQRIKNWENEIKNDINYENDNGFFYNVSLIKDKYKYNLRFIVWQINANGSKENAIENAKVVTTLLLNAYERKIIKVEVWYNPKGMMDKGEVIYNDYVK